MKFVLYYNNVCPGARACRILLRHLETDYSEVSVNLKAKEQMSDEFLKMNPDHCVPTLKAMNPRVEEDWHLWESRCIMKYLCEMNEGDELMGDSLRQQQLIDRWLYWDLGTFTPKMGAVFYPKAFRKEEPKEEDVTALHEKLKYLNDHLGKDKMGDDVMFLAGCNPSVADLSLAMLVEQTRLVVDTDKYKHLERWMDALAEEFGEAWEEVMAELHEWKDSQGL